MRILFVFLPEVLLIFCQLALANVCQSVVLVVLREVQTHLFAVGRHAHGDETVNEFVAQPTHGEGINKHDDDGQQVVEENHKTIPCACNKAFLNEDSRQHGAKDATCAVGGEHVERIVYAGVRAPVDGHVTDQRDDKGNEDALSHSDITCRWGDGYQVLLLTYVI